MVEYELVVADVSALRSGFAADLVSGGKVKRKVMVHELAIKQVYEAASKGDFIGVEELKKLKRAADSLGIEVDIVDAREGPRDEGLASIELARRLSVPLVTSSDVQKRVAEALGVKVVYGRVAVEKILAISRFFDEETMSVHLKERCPPRAKKGKPGRWILQDIGAELLEREEIERFIANIMEKVEAGEGFVEVQREGSTIVQLGGYRIIITRPPFSDGLEVTIAKPIAKLSLEDYNLPPKLISRLEERAEGILIAGAPGMGKTTFAQALAEFYLRKGKIVKTIEAPRGLQLPPDATQYAKTRSNSEELHDVLLLSRPDYTIFDEMRDTEDFKIFSDLRLAGVGMVGVVHATTPIDAIQRFIGRIELGVIPSIIDTVIFIQNGEVAKVYELETGVKVPHGLTEADLTRPVVIVKDFLTGEPEYEIYVFGERTFVVPLKPKVTPRMAMAKHLIEKTLNKYMSPEEYELQFTREGALIHVPPERLPIVLKKCRRKFERVEQRIGMRVEIKPRL